MKIEKTSRGFAITRFTDFNHVSCSLQESSLATDDAIWLGCDDANPRHLVPGTGWTTIEMPPNTVMNTRMHLTRKMVKKLLPVLEEFVRSGSLKKK